MDKFHTSGSSPSYDCCLLQYWCWSWSWCDCWRWHSWHYWWSWSSSWCYLSGTTCPCPQHCHWSWMSWTGSRRSIRYEYLFQSKRKIWENKRYFHNIFSAVMRSVCAVSTSVDYHQTFLHRSVSQTFLQQINNAACWPFKYLLSVQREMSKA